MPRRTLSPRITGGPAKQLSIPSLLTNVFYQSSTPGVCAMSRAADDRGNAAGDGAQAVERNSCTSGGIPHLFPSIAHCDFERRPTATVSAAIERARRFRARISEARIAEIDACAERDPRYVATDVLRASCAVRWLSLVIPRLFGGEGLDFGALIPALEEVSAGCVGVANLVAVHGLALMTVAATGDIRALERLCRELADSERSGVPALLSTAITEPQAGTDMENPVLLRKADIRNEAREVAGGYLLRGTKVFISNGNIPETHVDAARWHSTRPPLLWCLRLGGVSVGRVEQAGSGRVRQRADLRRLLRSDLGSVGDWPISFRTLELVLAATRAGVGAFAAGAARGA